MGQGRGAGAFPLEGAAECPSAGAVPWGVCSVVPPFPPLSQFTVAGTASAPPQPWVCWPSARIAEVPHLGLTWTPQLRDPGLAQPLVQAPQSSTASGHPLCSGVPQALRVQLCFPPHLWPVEADPLASDPEVGPASLPRRGTRPDSRWRGLTCDEKAGAGPLIAGASLLWCRAGLALVAQLFHNSAPSGCLQAASTRPLPRPVL